MFSANYLSDYYLLFDIKNNLTGNRRPDLRPPAVVFSQRKRAAHNCGSPWINESVFFGFQRFEDHVRAHINVATAQGEDEIVLFGVIDDILCDLFKSVDAQTAGHLGAQVGVVDVVGVGFAHGEDLADDRHVRDAQSGGKVVQQQRGAAVGVGLKDRPYLLIAHFHCGGERGGQLGGVVGKVVGDRDAARRAQDLKAAVHTGEFVQVLGDLRGCCAQIMGTGGSGERVVDIVAAGHLQVDFAQLFALVHEVKFFISAHDVAQVGGIVVIGLAEAEGDRRQIYVLQRLQHILIVAVDDEGVGGQVTELVEGLFDIIQRFEVVEVVGVDIEDDRDVGRELQECVHIFARLTHDDVAVADIAVAADEGQLAANDGGGVKAGADQHLAEHRGGGSFAVSAGYGDAAPVAAGDNTQHDAALDGGNALLTRGNQLGVILFDGGGIDHQLCTVDVLGAVTHAHGDAVAFDAVEGIALVHVGAAQLKARAVQDLGERAHARAADADEVDTLYIFQKMIVVHKNPLMYYVKLLSRHTPGDRSRLNQ